MCVIPLAFRLDACSRVTGILYLVVIQYTSSARNENIGKKLNENEGKPNTSTTLAPSVDQESNNKSFANIKSLFSSINIKKKEIVKES